MCACNGLQLVIGPIVQKIWPIARGCIALRQTLVQYEDWLLVLERATRLFNKFWAVEIEKTSNMYERRDWLTTHNAARCDACAG